MKVTVIIPAYNEEKTITDVVKGAKKYADRVLVIDNASEDNTGWLASKTSADVHFCPIKGAGVATAYGLAYSLNPHYKAEIVVTMDGDGQHNPDDIPVVIQPIIRGDADIVIGSRFMETSRVGIPGYMIRTSSKLMNHVPRYRRLGIGIITNSLNFGSSIKLTDAQSCFRAFSRKVVEDIKIKENGFGFSTEMLIKARKKGYRIKEVPISCIYYEQYSHNSTLPPFRHGIGVLLKTLEWRLRLRC